ncbi:hypothetical protein PTQ19_12105 [Microbacterium esteraromaticum]|uniref:hypothetical protein n=1 Tax=Microbacterium esteraromaticum TaxID=57043 RepID=UPI0023676879|nr:hypothetical protein [Microbacterium esteraromaticum]WDH78254.1 hypothetical protein PTQ19_12105 [Microbacterium esteraromaticum]
MSIDHHELERANWLLAHGASWHMADRRMAQRLKRRAGELARREAGASESAHHESTIHWAGARFIARGEDSSDKFYRGLLLWFVIIPAVAVTVGPALLVSEVLHRLTTRMLLSRGRIPQQAPWYLAAIITLAIGVAAWLIAFRAEPLAELIVWPQTGVEVNWMPVVVLVGAGQLTILLATTGWQARRYGWPGVVVRKLSGLPSDLVAAEVDAAAHQIADADAALDEGADLAAQFDPVGEDWDYDEEPTDIDYAALDAADDDEDTHNRTAEPVQKGAR